MELDAWGGEHGRGEKMDNPLGSVVADQMAVHLPGEPARVGGI